MKKKKKFSFDPTVMTKSPFYDFRDNLVQNIVRLMRKFWYHSKRRLLKKAPFLSIYFATQRIPLYTRWAMYRVARKPKKDGSCPFCPQIQRSKVLSPHRKGKPQGYDFPTLETSFSFSCGS